VSTYCNRGAHRSARFSQAGARDRSGYIKKSWIASETSPRLDSVDRGAAPLRSLALLLLGIFLLAFPSCGGGNGGGPTGGTLAISVSFTEVAPASLVVASEVSLIAVVANDPANKGVDWTVSCKSSNCGSLSPAHTASGLATTYAAPSSVPSGGSVTFSAAASADSSKVATTTVTVVTTITVTFTPAAPFFVSPSASAALSALVINDPGQEGVGWTVTCGSSACGSFSETHTASLVATTFTAPASVPGGGSVTITATATADVTKTATATVTVTTSTGNEGLLKGNYVFSLSGTDASGFYAAAGAFIADGAGNVTGEEDLLDPTASHTAVDFVGGYAIGSDGRGALRLATTDPTLGVDGVQSLTLTVVSPQHALVTGFDSSAISSGGLDFRIPGPVQGGYAFVLSGIDSTLLGELPPVALPLVIGGVLSSSGTSIDSVAEDVNDDGNASVVTSPLAIGILQGPQNPLQISTSTTLSARVTSDLAQVGVDWTATCSTGESGAYRRRDSSPTAKIAATPLISSASGVSIAFSQAPFPNLVTAGQARMSAVVSGDPSNAGVDWTVTCTSSDCGSFNPAHTQSGDMTISGATTTYMAPATVPTSGTITITATATADPSQLVTATVQIALPVTNCGSFDPPHTASSGTTSYTAPAVVPGGGTVTIIATASADLTKTAAATVTVGTGPSGPAPAPAPVPSFGTVGGTDNLGRGAATLGSRSFIYYLVSSRILRLIEKDSKGITAGSAFATSSSNSLSKASLSGNYAFTIAGSSTSPSQQLTTGALGAGGLFSADGNGNISAATVDVNEAGVLTNYSPTKTVNAGGQAVPPGTYTMSLQGRGSLVFNGPNGQIPGPLSQFALYLTADQGVLVVDLDFGLLGGGQALAQQGNPISAATFQGAYAAGLQGANGSATAANETLVGRLVSDGTSKFTGTADVSVLGSDGTITLTPGGSLTGTFTGASNGRFAGSLNTSATGTQQEIFYDVDNTTVLSMEADSSGTATGILQLQQLPASPAASSGLPAASERSRVSAGRAGDVAGDIRR